jgi:hypothetical protein
VFVFWNLASVGASMKSLLWHSPIVLKSMVRLPTLILVGCAVCAGLILIEFGSINSHRPLPGARLPPAEIAPAAQGIRKLADPLSSPTQRRPKTASSANDADSLLRDVRLTGVVIGPDVRIAIFAVTGANSRVLSEGGALKGWRLESISPEGVVLSGPAGNMVLEPQPRCEAGSTASACSGPDWPARRGDGWCAGATNGRDAYDCRQPASSRPRSSARLFL